MTDFRSLLMYLLVYKEGALLDRYTREIGITNTIPFRERHGNS